MWNKKNGIYIRLLIWKYPVYDDKKIVFEIFILFFGITKIFWSRKKCSYDSVFYESSLGSTQTLNSSQNIRSSQVSVKDLTSDTPSYSQTLCLLVPLININKWLSLFVLNIYSFLCIIWHFKVNINFSLKN
jgi:hypothetical protein